MKTLISGALLIAISTGCAVIVGTSQATRTAAVWEDVGKKLIDAMESVR